MHTMIRLRREQGYLPLPSHLRTTTLARKREEYASLVELAFARGREGLDQQIWHQIEIDVPRTRPGVQLWMQAATQRVTVSLCLLCKAKFSPWLLPWSEPRTDTLCLGDSAPCEWICTRHQRPRNAFLPSIFVLLHWCVSPTLSDSVG